MWSCIFKNSYVILLITIIVLSAIFYVFEIGWTTNMTEDGTVEKSFSWKYPVAIGLIIWVVWHFYLFPENSNCKTKQKGGLLESFGLSESVFADKVTEVKSPSPLKHLVDMHEIY